MSGMAEIEHLRHAEQRGGIIRCLREDYSAAMTGVSALASAMDMLGYPMSSETLTFHLNYLADSGFIRIWRNRDMPNSRPDRRPIGDPEIVRFAKLLPHGLHLLDGLIAADPGVKF